MSDTAMQLTMADGIARLTFDRPNARANVLSTPVWQEFGRHLDSLAGRSDLRGLIVDSAKPGVFIAGADLQEIHDTPPNDTGPTQALITLGHRVLEKLEALPYPTVAVIDGAALGGGLEVALACDFRFAAGLPATNPAGRRSQFHHAFLARPGEETGGASDSAGTRHRSGGANASGSAP